MASCGFGKRAPQAHGSDYNFYPQVDDAGRTRQPCVNGTKRSIGTAPDCFVIGSHSARNPEVEET